MLLLALIHAAAACDLAQVVPTGHDATVPLADGALAVGSIVRRTGACEGGATVEVLSANPWIRAGDPLAARGATGCVPEAQLAPLTSRLVVTRDLPGAPAPEDLVPGRLVKPLTSCDPPANEGGPVPLHGLRPISDSQLAAVEQVGRAYARHFGPIAAGHVGVSPWGYVALPVARYLSDEERAREADAEQLVTEEQREKITSALGPEGPHGEPVYTHFLGADPRLTDLWAQPDVVVAMLDLAAGWYPHCLALDHPHATARNCTLQIGDLAYYSPKRPDPLGHHDHYAGRCADIRLFRSDGSRYEAFYDRPDDRPGFGHAYSRPLTHAFLAYALEHVDEGDVFFNDPVVHEAFEQVRPAPGHDDHIHLCIR